ncbi:MAG: hypothetical protein ABI406_15955 [Ktedonobacteraceae bacterium]
MRQVVFKRLVGKTTALLSFVVMLFTVLTITGTGIASAHTRPSPITAPTACVRVHNGNFIESCFTPTVTTSSWCHGTQFFPATDQYKNPIDYARTDQNNMCVTVTYNFNYSFSSCDISFYLPAGPLATAVFNYTWHDLGGNHTQSLDENNSLAGWTQLFSDSSATSLTFNDNDNPGNKYLSWGSSWQFSLEVFCA